MSSFLLLIIRCYSFISTVLCHEPQSAKAKMILHSSRGLLMSHLQLPRERSPKADEFLLTCNLALRKHLHHVAFSILYFIMISLKAPSIFPISRALSLSFPRYTRSPEQFDQVDAKLHGIVIGKDSNIYASDTKNCRILIFESKGSLTSSFGMKGKGPYQFDSPRGLAVDRHFNLIICDYFNKRLQVWTHQIAFSFSIPTILSPESVAITKTGNIIALCKLTLEIYSKDGSYIKNIIGKLRSPTAIAVDNFDSIYVCDSHTIKILDSNGDILRSFSGNETNVLCRPSSLAVDREGNVVVCQNSVPEEKRIFLFDSHGEVIYSLGIGGKDVLETMGITLDAQGRIIVACYDGLIACFRQ